jgi:hypothetical protein
LRHARARAVNSIDIVSLRNTILPKT